MATEYYYYGARYYDPKQSFWLSVDPLSEITNSPYAYVWNDPVNFADPTGLMGEEWEDQDMDRKPLKIVLEVVIIMVQIFCQNI